MGIPYRKTAELFREVFGLKLVPASALLFDRKAAVRGEPIYEDLREKIRASDVVHADETSWRSDGVGHYVWFAGNEKLAFFHIDRHRSADVAKNIFGEDFGGTLVRDRYAAYNGTEWIGRSASLISSQRLRKSAGNMRSCRRPRGTPLPVASATASGSLLTTLRRGAEAQIRRDSLEGRGQGSKNGPSRNSALCEQVSDARVEAAETLRSLSRRPRAEISLSFLRRPVSRPPTITRNSLSGIW